MPKKYKYDYRDMLETTARRMGVSQEDLNKMTISDIETMIRKLDDEKAAADKERRKKQRGEHLM